MQNFKSWFSCIVIGCISIVGLWETIVGIGQLIGWANSGNVLYPMTGSFYNPGPLGGFIGMTLPIWVCAWYKCKRMHASVYEWGCIFVVILQMFTIGVSGSRAGLLAASAGCGAGLCTMIPKGSLRMRWVKLNSSRLCNRRGKYLLTAGVLLFLAIALTGGYKIKQDSADGRLLMWKIATEAIAENPAGVGWAKVAGAYGDAQERYFASGGGSAAEEMVAGSPEYVFNEYLQIGLAWGTGAAMLFAVILLAGIMIAVKRHNGALAGALTAFAIFAFASYPLQFAVFRWSLGALLCSAFIFTLPAKKISVVPIAVLLTGTSALLALAQRYDNELKTATDLYDSKCKPLYFAGAGKAYIERVKQITGSSSLTLEDANAVGKRLMTVAGFMFEYGRALNLQQHYHESNIIMEQAMEISSDPMILNIIAKNHMAMGDNDSAEKWLRRSINRLPSRMYPRYLLCQLYYSDPDRYGEMLLKEAAYIADMPVKVHSPAVTSMREKVKNFTKHIGIPEKCRNL